MLPKIEFENNSFIFKGISFDKKRNLLVANKFDKNNNFIKKVELKMGEIPKNIKKKLNPL
ncbi:MAG: hypothetical protein U9Q30_09425 [Campylobacterota bacterium]|nr:hypothetical protein [Campylobacterota bacterium]